MILFSAAISYRQRPAAHKCLMLLVVLNFLGAAVARIPIAVLQDLGPLWFFGFPAAMALLCLGVDTWRHRRVNPVFLAGTVLLIASFPLRLALMNTAAWMSAATWLTSFV